MFRKVSEREKSGLGVRDLSSSSLMDKALSEHLSSLLLSFLTCEVRELDGND